MSKLPEGSVTFLFTDIEGSTRLLQELGDRYAQVLTDHRRLLREAFERYRGREVDTQGDSFFVAFSNARDAVAAAVASQTALAGHLWPSEASVRVRMGIHTGEPLIADEHYVGIDVHRGARIAAAAHGGQVLLSEQTRELLTDGAASMVLRELGAHRLKDLAEPEQLFQLVIEGLPSTFPPPRVHEEAPAAAGLPDYSLPPADVPCPYKGLVAFEPEDHELFFGREQLVAELVRRLEEASFLAVVGPSGSGKSSLVRAGVVPELERRQEALESAIVSPGPHPLAELAAVGHARLLVVDQFEEVFTLCRDEEERRSFIEALLTRAERGDRVIVALRADFYGHCAAYPALAAALEAHQALVGPMSEEELRRAIERPAAQSGLVLEPGLAEAVLRDVVGEPGALPLLSHSLLETWRRRSGRMLTLIGYLQSGGVRGAIATTAEAVYQDAFSREQQNLARNIFLRLTELGEGTEDTRRRVSTAELTPRPEQEAAVAEVLRTLADARLVTIGERTVEVAHEALIRHWPTLRSWLDEDREGRLLHRRLTEAAQEWQALERDAGLLYRGARLAGAVDWAAGHDAELNELEREFVAASREAEVGEVEATKRRNRRLRALAAALALFLAAAIVAGVFALVLRGRAEDEADRAERQARVATARELAAAAVANLEADPELSLLLGLEAVQTSRSAGEPVLKEAEEALRRGLHATRVVLNVPGFWGVGFSPDGKRIATGRHDGTATVWDAATGKALLTLRGHGDRVIGLSWNRDGSRIVTSSQDQTAKVWDADTGRLLRTLSGHTDHLLSNVVSSDGRLAATSSKDRTARVWDLDSGRQLQALRHDGVTQGLGFSPDATRLAVADGGVGAPTRVWDAQTGRELFHFGPEATAVKFSPDGRFLATAHVDDTARLWEARTGREIRSFLGHSGPVETIAFSADGSRLATGSGDGTARVWDVATGRQLLALGGYGAPVEYVIFSPDGRRLAAGGGEGTVKVWDVTLEGSREVRTLAAHEGPLWVVYSPDGEIFGTIGLDAAKLWHAASGRPLGPLPGARSVDLAFSPDGREIAVGEPDGAVGIWGRDRNQVRRLEGHRGAVGYVDFGPTGDRLATASLDGTVKVWDLGSGHALHTLRGHREIVFDVVFSPDGAHLATTSQDETVKIWDVASGREVRTLRGHTNNAFAVSWSRDGRRLASSGADGRALVWDVGTGKRLLTLAGHEGPVPTVAFAPDGRRIATGSAGTVRIWDSRTGVERLALEGHTQNVLSVAFSPDGRHLAVGGEDGTVRIYALRVEELIPLAQKRATRPLTAEECRQYLHVDACPDRN